MCKRVVAYCRVSTNGQVGEDKFGIDTSWCSDYMVKNAMIVSKVTGYMIIKPKNSISLTKTLF